MKSETKRLQLRMYLFSALIALTVSLGVWYLSSKSSVPATSVTTMAAPGHNVLYTKDSEGNITPLDFTETTQKVLDAVVHIKSSGKATMQEGYRQLPDPFREFFKDSPFGQYYQDPEGKSPEGRMQPMPRVGTGSGVIINTKGYIVTNNHVIDQADEIEVTLHNNESYTAKVIGTDPTTDLALLQIDAENLKSVALVNSDDVEVGEWVLAIGNPFSLNSTVTAGIVSAKARNININKEKFAVESFIQTDAAINPGNSGGALVNLNGDLVGINTAIASRTGSYSGYGFAVPSNIVSKVVEDLLKYGDVQRGVLGVSIQNLDGNLAREKGINRVEGVYVAQVNDNSAADKAGIQPGDVIIGVNDMEVGSSPRLQELIARHRPGDKVKVKLSRDGEEREIDVILENTAGSTALVKKEYSALERKLGAEFRTLDREEAKELQISAGVEVTKLFPGLIRQETQMRTGFIITHVNGEQIRTVEELQRAINDKDNEGIMLKGRYKESQKWHYYAFGLDS